MPEKQTKIVYREVSDLEPLRLPPDHLLVKVGFTPDLPLYLRRLNDCLSRGRINDVSSIYHGSQLESIAVELTPDSKQPKLTMETEYTEERKVRLDVFPGKEDPGEVPGKEFITENTQAMLTIGGQSGSPLGVYADTIGIVEFTDMQDFLKRVLPEVRFGLYWTPHTGFESQSEDGRTAKEEAIEEPIYLDFLSLTQEEFDELEPEIYTLLADRAQMALVAPLKVGDKTKCHISLFRYGGKVPDVERFMEGFADLLERNLPEHIVLD